MRGLRWGGFTLVELLMVLAMIAILWTIAIPGYSFFVNGSRLTTVTNDLVTALQLARSEAIKQRKRITLCKTRNPYNAVPACDPLASWQHGWLVFVDSGTVGVIDAGDNLLWVQNSVPTTVTITTSNFSNYVSYLSSGESQGPNGLGNGIIRVCVGSNRRDIIINNTGRIRLVADTC